MRASRAAALAVVLVAVLVLAGCSATVDLAVSNVTPPAWWTPPPWGLPETTEVPTPTAGAGASATATVAGPAPTATRAATAPAPTAPAVPTATAAVPTPVPVPTRTLQQQVDATPSGGALIVQPGVYREAVTIARPMTVDGQGRVTISGADVWTGWAPSGGDWVSTGPIKSLPSGSYPTCLGGSDKRCAKTEMVFRDGAPLYQRPDGADPGPGQFALVAATDRRVRLGDDPAGHLLEVTVRSVGIDGTGPGVTVRGLAVTAVGSWRQGAIRSNLPGWTLEAVEVHHNASWGVELKGDGTHILGSHIHHNGTLGLTFGNNATIEGNELDHDGTEEPNYNSEGGAMKFAVNRGSRVVNNRVHDVWGPGIWCDINCDGVEIAGNRISRVAHIGIFYEISANGWIHDNVVDDAGMFWQSGIGGACIAVSNSRGTTVERNVAAWCRDGIVILAANRYDLNSDGRPDDANQSGCGGACTAWDYPYGNEIRDNDVLYDATGGMLFGVNQLADSPADACNPANGNVAAGNRRWVAPAAADVGPPQAPGSNPAYDRYLDCAPRGGRYSWLDGFQATEFGAGVSDLSTAQKDALVARWGLPPQRAIVFES